MNEKREKMNAKIKLKVRGCHNTRESTQYSVLSTRRKKSVHERQFIKEDTK